MINDVTPEEIREVLHYDPETGIFRWKKRVAQRVHVGDIAGSRHHSGYLTFWFKGRARQAHRMAWIYMTGEFHDGPMDHINGVRDDNRFENLRPTTAAGNAQNRRTQQRGAESGLLGVARNGGNGKWQAYIRVDHTPIYLGTFATAEEAHQAYIEAKRKLHSTCTI